MKLTHCRQVSRSLTSATTRPQLRASRLERVKTFSIIIPDNPPKPEVPAAFTVTFTKSSKHLSAKDE